MPALHFFFLFKFLRLYSFSWSCKVRLVVEKLIAFTKVVLNCQVVILSPNPIVPGCFVHVLTCKACHLQKLTLATSEACIGSWPRNRVYGVRFAECQKWSCSSYPLQYIQSWIFFFLQRCAGTSLLDFWTSTMAIYGNLVCGWLSKSVFFNGRWEKTQLCPSVCNSCDVFYLNLFRLILFFKDTGQDS